MRAPSTTFNSYGEPIIPTAAMEDGVDQIKLSVDRRYHGVGFHSMPRFGKSTFSEYLAYNRGWADFSYVPRHALARSIGATFSLFADWFLAQIGFEALSRQTPQRKLDRIINSISTILEVEKSSRLFLIVDDANQIERDAFQHFVTIDNEMVKRGMHLFVVFLFQDNHTSNKSEAINRAFVTPQVRERYLCQFHRFHGIRDVSDLRLFIQRFEEEAEMHHGAAVSLPMSTAPHLYEGAFRLHTYSTSIWEAGVSARVAAGFPERDEWPMQPTRLIVDYLSRRVICKPGFTDLKAADIEMAVRYSGLAEYDGSTGEVKFTKGSEMSDLDAGPAELDHGYRES